MKMHQQYLHMWASHLSFQFFFFLFSKLQCLQLHLFPSHYTKVRVEQLYQPWISTLQKEKELH